MTEFINCADSGWTKMSPTGIEKVRLTLGRLLDWRRIHGLLGMRLAEMDTNKYPAGQLDTHKFSNHDWCSAPNPKDPLHKTLH